MLTIFGTQAHNATCEGYCAACTKEVDNAQGVDVRQLTEHQLKSAEDDDPLLQGDL